MLAAALFYFLRTNPPTQDCAEAAAARSPQYKFPKEAAMKELEPLLTEKKAAELLNLSLATLRRRRAAGQPPAWIKFKASVRYSRESIRRFIEDSERNSQRP